MNTNMKTTGLNLASLSMQDLAALLSQGKITSVQLVEDYLERVERDNIAGYGLRAVIELAPEHKVLEQARMLDLERATGTRSKLHGIPIMIKDNIATSRDMGMRTTAGSWALYDVWPKQNASVVDALLTAGLIILGKTTCCVYSGFFSPDAPLHGWSPRGGDPQSAYGKEFPASGSSTGSAHAVAAGFCASAIGTETCGSLVYPACAGALYGLKPTLGLIPTDGVIPISKRFDCIGPMCKTVWDLAATMDILVPGRNYLPLAQLCSDIERVRVGLYSAANTQAYILDTDQSKVLSELVADLGSLLDVVVIDLPGTAGLSTPMDASDSKTYPLKYVWKIDFCSDIEKYLAGTDGNIKTLKELIAWNESKPNRAFHPHYTPGKGQEYLTCSLRLSGDDQSGGNQRASQILESSGQYIESVMDELDLDVLLAPKMSHLSRLAATLGFPICTVPYKLQASGEPFGVFFMARRGREDVLIKVMAMCESTFPSRRVPPAFDV